MNSPLATLASDLGDALQPIADAVGEMMVDVSEAFREAFAPLLARKRPYETGKELAEVAVENRLTNAERHPVRAVTVYGDDFVDVEYNDGSGWEQFVSYDKEAVRDE